ncbi:MAG TPA: PDR/VanB family oxidoreductase [Bradyrhizobium sp.]|nr:PDR/VanB family oxidoreductase [Bradyrhizobium sp.]
MTAPPITTVKTVVDAIEHGGPGIKVFTLVDPDRWELPPFKPGAHIDLHLPGGLVRTYSLCNDPGDGTRYVIAVKREAGGRGGSMALHDKIVTGDVIGVSLPRGGFDADENIRRYVFVAGGIGVTPYLSIAAYLSRIGHPDFTVHAVARDRMPLEHLLAPLIERERIVLHRTSKTGRPDIGALLGQAASGTAAGCCGPEGVTLDFERATADWPGDRVHVERFVAPRLAVDPGARPYTIALARSGAELPVRAGQSMLAALQEFGIAVPTSCCGGICGACKVSWLEGRPVHRDRVLSPYERQRYLMVCVAGADSGRLVLDL